MATSARPWFLDAAALNPSRPPWQTLPGRTLLTGQVEGLITFANSRDSFFGSAAACFEPHMGIVFYDGERVVASMSICFACNRMTVSPEGSAYDEVMDGRIGFSSTGRVQLQSLSEDMGFSYCHVDDELYL